MSLLRVRGGFLLLALLPCLALVETTSAVDVADKILFNRDVRPILSDTCFKCHGPDANKRKKNLRMDVAESAYRPRKGGTPIVPGKPDESEAVRRVLSDDADEMMPPPDSGLKLTADQKQTFKRWVEQGAAYQPHWGFVTPHRPELPAVKDAKWPRNEVDRFVLARLEGEGLKPSAEADRETLIRRVTLDLIGVPPTPDEVRAFVEDRSPNAYENVVDRLLASPHYGERMALQWLDGARYADSHGYQADWERYQYRWRDWVIDAFNRNEPYDQFTIDQLAGDLEPNATLDQRIATGFNRNHRINTEGGIIPEEWRVETVIDRVETTSLVFLGLTTGCCRCHDHKYDPIAQKEFYQLFSFFNNNNEAGTGAEKAGNHPPILAAPLPEQRAKLDALKNIVVAAEADVRAHEKDVPALQATWEQGPAKELKSGVAWAAMAPTKMVAAGDVTKTQKAKLAKQKDDSILVSGMNPTNDTYEIDFKPTLKTITALRLDALPDASLPSGGPGRSAGGNLVLTDVQVKVAGKPVKLAKATADYSQPDWPVAHAIDADREKSGWAIFPKVNEPHFAVFSFERPVEIADKATISVTLAFNSVWPQHQLGHFKLSATDSPTPHDQGLSPALFAAIQTPVEKRDAKQAAQVTAYFRESFAGDLTVADRALAKAKGDYNSFEATVPTVMVMDELPQPRDAFVLLRGEYDKHGDKVTADTPKFLPPMDPSWPKNRLGLAKWIVDPRNPLTARVWVNRAWEHVFGVGLCKTVENLGSQAAWPSHPELLDWLATEFVRLHWDMKAMQREMVLSATYRQSSHVTPELVERDPENRLLARGPRFRLQGETIRDQALAAGGLLVEKLGGPSVRPYMPPGVWDETSVYGNLRNYQPDANENRYRRTMYTIWKRTAPPPTMILFDAPTREVCTVHRSRTDTPLQALALLNEQTFVEAAKAMAQRMIEQGGATPESRIAFGYQLITCHAPDTETVALLKAGLEKRLATYAKNPDAAKQLLAEGPFKPDAKLNPAELAAYATTANVLLNLDEAVTRE